MQQSHVFLPPLHSGEAWLRCRNTWSDPGTWNHRKLTSGAEDPHSFEVFVVLLISVSFFFFYWCLQRQPYTTLGIAERKKASGTEKGWSLELCVCRRVCRRTPVSVRKRPHVSVCAECVMKCLLQDIFVLITELQRADHSSKSPRATNIIFNRGMSLMHLGMVAGSLESRLCLSTEIKKSYKLKYL